MRQFVWIPAALVLLAPCRLPAEEPSPSPVPAEAASPDRKIPYDPTDRYEARELEGFRVLVHRDLLEREAELGKKVLKLLESQLFAVTRAVPAEALGKLRRIAIWAELREPHHPCMAYHPDAGWLREHDMNPEKAGCVEIANARNFLIWCHDQPWMVLHELAHGYHHQFLPGGYDNADLIEAHRRAVESGRYDAVLKIQGRTEPAYAKTNPMEYFAEASEAYFGTNDFYPFVRAELKQHDPDMYRLVERLWGVGGG